MRMYDPTQKTVTDSKLPLTVVAERTYTGTEDLYCGESFHPFADVLLSYKTATLTLQEAFTALLLEATGEETRPLYVLEEETTRLFGEGAYTKLTEAVADRCVVKKTKHGTQYTITKAS